MSQLWNNSSKRNSSTLSWAKEILVNIPAGWQYQAVTWSFCSFLFCVERETFETWSFWAVKNKCFILRSQLSLGAQHSGGGMEGGMNGGMFFLPSANTRANPTCSPAKGTLRVAANGQYYFPNGKGQTFPIISGWQMKVGRGHASVTCIFSRGLWEGKKEQVRELLLGQCAMARASAVAVSLCMLPIRSSISGDRDRSGWFSPPRNQSEAAKVTLHQKSWLSGSYRMVCIKWDWFQPSCWRRAGRVMKPTAPLGTLGVLPSHPKPTVARAGGPDSTKTISPSWSWLRSLLQQWEQGWFCDFGGCCQHPGGQELYTTGRALSSPLLWSPRWKLRGAVLTPSGWHQLGTMRCLRGRAIKLTQKSLLASKTCRAATLNGSILQLL